MVRLSQIYTKTGDKGTTMLGDGNTVPKHDLRVEAYGTVDEANAAVGLAAAELAQPGAASPGSLLDEVRAELHRLQHDLFDVGADLCVPREAAEPPGARLRVTPAQVERLERLIDRFNEPLSALNSFVLPGGSMLSARLHLARTITRRAERLVAHLVELEPQRTNEQAMIYLNRLSDLLFVLGRWAAKALGEPEYLWQKPGAR
jgi:cob(I)alamin adenosyltransferase